MAIQNFEDLQVWQLSRDLAVKVYELSALFPKSEMYALTDQVRRSSTSVSANIAEGFGRYHYKESKQFYYMARGSLLETKSHLLIAEKLFNLPIDRVNIIVQDIKVLSIKLSNFINSIGN
jgi:four helix bundle protein